MKKVYILFISLMLLLGFALRATAANKAILISEVQTSTEALASPEFVEIYNNGAEETAKSTNSNIWTWLLVAAGLGTIGYGIYEYRTEIQIRIQKLRAKFGARG